MTRGPPPRRVGYATDSKPADPGMPEDTAKRMARLVKAVERSRAKNRRHKHRLVGEELQAVIELAEQFPLRDRGEMRYPVLKRLLARQG